jgi:hypothetical protein
MVIEVRSSETNDVKYTLDGGTMVYRWEPGDAPTPMTPHASPYAPYGRYEFHYNHLFVVEQRALDALTGLRGSQGYFAGNVVLHSAQLCDLVSAGGPGTVVLEDIKFNMTVLGGDLKGALIIASPNRIH